MIEILINYINKKNLKKIHDFLVKNPTYINVQNYYGDTPLILSVKMNNNEYFLKFLKFNPNLYLSTNVIYSSIFNTKYNKVNYNENNVMWWACKLNRSNMIEKLIKIKFNINYNKYDISPLLFSIQNNNLHLFNLLLLNNANYNYVYFNKHDFDYTFALKDAIKYDNIEMVKKLLSYDDIKTETEKFRLSLSDVCLMKKNATINNLIKKTLKNEKIL